MSKLANKLFEDGNTDNTAMGVAYDIYYPSPESAYKESFVRGMERGAKNCSMPAKAKTLVEFVKEDLQLGH